MSHRLFVRGFSAETEAGFLEDLFGNVGTVKKIEMRTILAGGIPRPVSYIEMSSAEEVRDCIDRYHGKTADGQTLIVTEDKPHVPDPEFRAKRAAAAKAKAQSQAKPKKAKAKPEPK